LVYPPQPLPLELEEEEEEDEEEYDDESAPETGTAPLINKTARSARESRTILFLVEER
jgi:hypothetical protein